MEIKEEKIEQTIYEVKKTYVANDGTEFKDLEECEKYEESSKCVINSMFNKLKTQKTEYIGDCDMFNMFQYEDDMYAVKIENANQLEIVNKWIRENSEDPEYLSAEAIGTIQLLLAFDSDIRCSWGVSPIGTPEQLKQMFSDAVDKLYNELIETEGEKA